jgi:hypothetical protein
MDKNVLQNWIQDLNKCLSGGQSYKTFLSSSSMLWTNKLECFLPSKHFQQSLIFASMVEAYLVTELIRSKHLPYLQIIGWDIKRASLFDRSVSEESRMFWTDKLECLYLTSISSIVYCLGIILELSQQYTLDYRANLQRV